jgi:DNA-binding NarL/FixJ family response regulator
MTGYGADTSVDTPVYATNTLSECISNGELAVKFAREIGWLASESFALGCLGLCFAGQGKHGRAFHIIQQSIVVATEIEHRQWMTAGQRNLGLLYLDLLALPAARNHLEKAVAMAHELESMFWIRVATSALALVLIQQHELEQAEATLNNLTVNHSAPQTIGVRVFWRARAELALAKGQPQRALQIVNQLLDSTPHADEYAQGMIPLLAKLRGEILTALRHWPEAEAELQAARHYATLQGARPLLWRIDVSLGKLHHARARYHKTEQCFANARRLIRELADEIPDIELRNNFVRQANATMALPRPSTPLRMAKQAKSGLTRREREVAALVAMGKSNREIAEILVLGVRTIEGHVSSILDKLGFTSRTEIALWTMENSR